MRRKMTLKDPTSSMNTQRIPAPEPSAITPPCSPPDDVTEIEEGELLDDNQELDEISDEELGYDNGRYYRSGQAYKDSSSSQAVPPGFVFDSPASPDISQEVSGSPLKIIPRSPTQEIKGNSSGEEDDDMDEDLLYLRLIALRSLASEDKKPEEEAEVEGDNELAVEMRELLEEAEVAASENVEDFKTAVISEIITIDDDDPISEMKLNLQDSYLKYKKSVEVVDLSPSYSPTQSPTLTLSPVYEAPGVDSPEASPPLVDLTSPYTPTAEVPTSPPLPPLPPPVRTVSPPPLPPTSPSSMSPPPPPLIGALSPSLFPDPVPTTSTRHGEPLPPGEDLDPSSPRAPTNMDMEIDSGDDAETNFFLSQQSLLFPASVWDFKNDSKTESESRLTRVRDIPEEDGATVGKKRKLEETDVVGSPEETDVAGSPEVTPEESEEEEESLRSLLLAQVSQGRGKTETNKKVKPSSEKNEDKEKLRKELTPKKAKHSHEKRTPKKNVEVTKTSEKKVPKSKKENKAAMSTKSQKSKMKEPRKLKNTASKSQRQKQKPIKISEADQLKFFPNLTKRVVFNLTEEESESESEEDNKRIQAVGTKNATFGLDLEAFLKEARNSSKPAQNKNLLSPVRRQPKVVEKKIALTPQLKAQASKLTLETKKKLIDAQISHLSKSKQEEYERLKEMIEKKQKEKQSKKKAKTEVGKENIERTLSLGEEEEAALRESLLTNMKKRVQSKESPVKGEKSKDRKMVENISVEISGENRDVRIEREESCSDMKDGEDCSTESGKLESLEKDVVGRRKKLSASLFKLSAYMSQLQKDISGVDSAVKYIEELKRQLNETEKLLATRKSKVDNLRTVILESHQTIKTEKENMLKTEEECRELGLKIVGDSYKPPVDGAENISKKLEMINNTAKKVKTADTGIQGLVFSGNIEGLLGSGEVGNAMGDYRSPLEHLSQTNKTVIDHSKELCRFALSGKCLDDSCQLQHLPP